MDFKWKWSALYINLYNKIALHLKKKKINDLDCLKKKQNTVNNMQNAVCFDSLCFLHEVPSWLNQEHCALLLSFSLSFSHSGYSVKKNQTVVERFSHFRGCLCRTWAGCKGSWNYAQVLEGGRFGIFMVYVADLLNGCLGSSDFFFFGFYYF